MDEAMLDVCRKPEHTIYETWNYVSISPQTIMYETMNHFATILTIVRTSL